MPTLPLPNKEINLLFLGTKRKREGSTGCSTAVAAYTCACRIFIHCTVRIFLFSCLCNSSGWMSENMKTTAESLPKSCGRVPVTWVGLHPIRKYPKREDVMHFRCYSSLDVSIERFFLEQCVGVGG